MKNLKRTILGAAVVLIALGFSAFSTATVDSPYGKDINPSGHNWVNLDNYTKISNMTAPLEPGQYRCVLESEVCTGEFPSQPAPNTSDPAVTIEGRFEFEPLP